MKKCLKCNSEKPVTEFYKNKSKKDGLRSNCKDCCKEASKAWNVANTDRMRKTQKDYYAVNPDKKKAQAKAWAKANPERVKNNRLKHDFGIGLQDYNQMHAEQNGCCAICNTHESNLKTLVVDHNHETGQVRGLLCHYCNTSIGFLKDKPHLARATASYLIRTDQARALHQQALEVILNQVLGSN